MPGRRGFHDPIGECFRRLYQRSVLIEDDARMFSKRRSDLALSCPNRGGGYRTTVDLLELKNPPTAAVCFNDLVAFGLIQTLQQAGRKPGSGFGVIGFNDVPVVVDNRPSLTTVDTAPRQVGEIAAELLLRRIAKPDSHLQRVILQPRLIVRQSCGTLA